jgi:ABC-type polysaccharide/polyol phosphate export permease
LDSSVATIPKAMHVERRRLASRYLDLVRMLAIRTLKIRYRGSILGVYWSLSQPLIMTLVYTAIFGTAFASYYNNSILDYVLACFVGLAVMNFYGQSTGQALTSVVNNGALLNKVRLPFTVFPFSVIVANGFQFIIGILPIMAIIAGVRSHNPLNILALAIPTIALLLVCAGFGLITSALFVYFRDLPYLNEMFTFFVWMTSPIFYPAQLVPPAIRSFIVLNPLAMIVESFRQIALSGEPPSLFLLGLALGSGLFFFVLGLCVFFYLRDDFMDLV